MSGRWQAVFLDRDGTLNVELPGWLRSPDELALVPGAGAAVARLNAAGLRVVVVTNQSAVARGLLSECALAGIHQRLVELVAADGGRLDLVLWCPHGPDSTCACRKPRPGLLREALRRLALDPARCVVVGDAERDLAAGRAAGCGATVLVRTGKGRALEAELLAGEHPPTVVHDDLAAAVDWILDPCASC
jgi:D-glycero-D-manno-heptose 1,7-bisphosphate phosphatase